jgi:hypothetical protein
LRGALPLFTRLIGVPTDARKATVRRFGRSHVDHTEARKSMADDPVINRRG